MSLTLGTQGIQGDSKVVLANSVVMRREGAPLGIEVPIPPGGVFPLLEASESAGEGHRLENLDELKGVNSNYSSYEQRRQQADDLFEQELAAGFAAAQSRQEEVGKLPASA